MIIGGLRAFNNPDVVRSVTRLIELVDYVQVITNAEVDRASTPYWLRDFSKDKVEIIQIFSAYNWTVGLNAIVFSALAKNMGRTSQGLPTYDYILNISTETLLERDHLDAMVRAAKQGAVAVETSFQGVLSGNPVTLGPSYKHGRNTCMLYRADAPMLYFDPFCDQAGGMEDWEWILRAKAAGLKVEYLDLKVPLRVGINYAQPEKEKREQEAMRKILHRTRGIFILGTTARERIEAAIAEMGLDEFCREK